MVDAANGVLGMFPSGICISFVGMVLRGLFLIVVRCRRRSSKPSGISVDLDVWDVGVDMDAEEKASL
jgi:hypothetical protein